jgi:hypothetical protein
MARFVNEEQIASVVKILALEIFCSEFSWIRLSLTTRTRRGIDRTEIFAKFEHATRSRCRIPPPPLQAGCGYIAHSDEVGRGFRAKAAACTD